ncbi:MAG: hypothetical protein Q9208_001871 [Pyrenodesmia sp. 3 TL-2023]
MDSQYYEQAQPLPPPPPPPRGYAPIIPGRSPGYYPIQTTYGPPYPSDPLAAYTLPISRLPGASHTRHHRHYGSHKEDYARDPWKPYRDEYARDSRRSPREDYARDVERMRGSIERVERDLLRGRKSPSPARHYARRPLSDDVLTDASLGSDVSEAFSADSFAFDASNPDILKMQTDNEGEEKVCGEGAVEDKSTVRWASLGVDNAGADGGGGGGGVDGGDGGDGGGGEPTATMYARIEAVKKGARKAAKPSPYLSSGATVLYSRHLQGQHLNLSSLMDFVAHFSILGNFKSKYYVIHRDAIQRPENWQRLVLLAKKQRVLHLLLRSHRTHINWRKTDTSSSSDEGKPTDLGTDSVRHTRSTELSSPVTIEPTLNTSDRRNQMATVGLAGFDDAKSGTPQKSVKDTRPDVQLVRVNDFHHFYWLAAAPTVPTSLDRSPRLASRERERERERKESISFNLDKRHLRQSVAQMQTYLQKRKKISRQAYAQCPSRSLREVDHWAARIHEDGVVNERKEDDLFRSQAQAQADEDRLVAQKIHQLRRIEEEHRLAKQREERPIGEQMHSDDEQLSQRTEILQKEEECRLAAEGLGRLGSEQLVQKPEKETERRTESEAKGELSCSDDADRQESPDEHRSGSRTSSSSAGASPRSASNDFTNPVVEIQPAVTDQDIAKTILKLSKELFAFFFPLAYSSSMTDKYWGAVYWLLDHRESSLAWRYEYHDDLVRIRWQLQPMARLLRLGPPPGELRLPIEFSRAWIHLLSFWTLVTTNRSIGTLQEELRKCLRLIEVGRSKTLKSRIPSPLEAHEAVLPAGIVSLLVSKTVGEVMDGTPEIGPTYYAYLSKLEQEVQQKPYNRGHQEKITSVRQEISCILAVLQDQERCIRKLRTTLMRGRLDAPPGFPQRREAYILQNCLISISDRMQTFNALDERARGIAAFNLYRIESNRDRQEGAILIFTIVTIIFLPLSFVSSFFGMNTSDVRNMSTPQWAFWAAAIPLTLIVLGVSVFVARNMEPLKDLWYSLSDRWRTKSAVGDFYPAPAVQTQQLYARPQRGLSASESLRPPSGNQTGQAPSTAPLAPSHSVRNRYSMTYHVDKPTDASSKNQTFHPTSKRLKPAIIEIVRPTRLTPSALLAPETPTSIQGPVTNIRHRDHHAQQPQQRNLERGSPAAASMSILPSVSPTQTAQPPRPTKNLRRRHHRPHQRDHRPRRLDHLLAQTQQSQPEQQQRLADEEGQRAEEQELADAVTEGGGHEAARERDENGEGVEFAVWEVEETGQAGGGRGSRVDGWDGGGCEEAGHIVVVRVGILKQEIVGTGIGSGCSSSV